MEVRRLYKKYSYRKKFGQHFIRIKITAILSCFCNYFIIFVWISGKIYISVSLVTLSYIFQSHWLLYHIFQSHWLLYPNESLQHCNYYRLCYIHSINWHCSYLLSFYLYSWSLKFIMAIWPAIKKYTL